MTPTTDPDPERAANGHDQQNTLGAIADELKQECERLQQIAERLRVREQALSEMEANYPHFKEFVYARLRKRFANRLEELPLDKDLETFAKEEGALPLESFIDEIEQMRKAP